MSRHQLTYIDMYPEPIEREPSPLAVWLGAAFTLAALYIVTIVLFSL